MKQEISDATSSMSVTKMIIALSGVNTAGKTAVLQQLVSRLAKQGVPMTAQVCGHPHDNRYRGVFKGKSFVVCTAGDTEDVIKRNFNWARSSPGYDVLVMATRSHVGVKAVDALIQEAAKDGAYPHFITKMRAASPATRAIAEKQAIEDIFALIP